MTVSFGVPLIAGRDQTLGVTSGEVSRVRTLGKLSLSLLSGGILSRTSWKPMFEVP